MLLSNLPTLEILEQGGLEPVNDKLSELLSELRVAETTDSQNEIINSLNNLMGSAIYLFPHLATAVEVKFLPGTEGKSDTFAKRYGFDAGAQRRRYNDLSEAYSQKHGQPFPNTLVLPLPYGFSSVSSHGSGARAALGASSETVYFSFTNPDRDWSKEIPVLRAEVELPLIVPRTTEFELDEVESIKFVVSDEYTPYVNARGRNTELIDRGNPVGYYLIFRDFADYRAFRKRENFPDLTEEEWINAQTIWTPRSFTNLWHVDYRTLRSKLLKRGFIAKPAEKGSDVTLFEYSNVAMPRDDDHESEAILFTNTVKKDNKSSSRIYNGMEAVSRLLEIPVQARRY